LSFWQSCRGSSLVFGFKETANVVVGLPCLGQGNVRLQFVEPTRHGIGIMNPFSFTNPSSRRHAFQLFGIAMARSICPQATWRGR
ncbi:MAG: hypothetical protein L0215_27700, partial [Gemmataceae bacterium]|nr:hypothetical protein [Gemmataceae bacterium]